ncbi:MAG: beta-Ala-His dipeptidase [Candidatus Lokiarchaeota archaeon]|nr:beta-Ala-His dipeptidase [Candidatus Lokiarchaeota archaeon]
MILDNLEPRAAWRIFEEIFSSTPRPSNHEARIRSRIADWAAQHAEKGISCSLDPAGNLFLRRRAAIGCEAWHPVLLQGHMDMVCETSRPEGFDFLNLPIPIQIDPDGEWVSADGTTLGADDGLGASIALALLIDDDPAFVHGPVEVLLTFAEEAGLDGAYRLDPAALGIEARHMINVDSEELGVVTIGSAGGGGVRLETALAPDPQASAQDLAFCELSVAGLRGGHSGVDIHLPRANAIKLVARLLCAVESRMEAFLVSWDGGTRHNAIPRSSTARFAVHQSDKEVLGDVVKAEWDGIEHYYKGKAPDGSILEPDVAIEIRDLGRAPCISASKTAEIVRLANALPHGPHRFSPSMPSLVETSCNLAVVKVSAGDGQAEFSVSARSNIDEELESFRRGIAATGHLAYWRVEIGESYPAWTPDPSSAFLGFVRERYEARLGRPVAARSVHAGLECSIIARKVPALSGNIASIGPEVQNAHTPAERARIADVQVLYDVLKDVLSSAKRMP